MLDKYEVPGRLADDCMSVSLLHGTMMKRLLRKFKDKDIQVTIEPMVRQRSARQNRYLHGPVITCIRAWFLETEGIKYDHDTIYTWLRVELLGEKPQVIEIAGRECIVMTGKRFSAMSTKEFAEAVDTILSKMAEKGCVIPEPRRENFLNDFIDVKDT